LLKGRQARHVQLDTLIPPAPTLQQPSSQYHGRSLHCGGAGATISLPSRSDRRPNVIRTLTALRSAQYRCPHDPSEQKPQDFGFSRNIYPIQHQSPRYGLIFRYPTSKLPSVLDDFPNSFSSWEPLTTVGSLNPTFEQGSLLFSSEYWLWLRLPHTALDKLML